MKILDIQAMKSLSFPDFDVKKVEFFSEEKKLKIYVEGAWLEINGGSHLKKGVLFFNDWESFLIRRFDPYTKKWSEVNEYAIEPLKDLCEVKFTDSAIYLCGFGKQISHWMEWKIQKAKNAC
ncbi:MAG: hypothetical protein KF898_09010 [Parachlamydiales bacterium]|nr:hypothetical protein [Candidatus Acheromyda pituitae]